VIRGLKLALLPGRLAVCRLPARAPVPAWAVGRGFCSVTRTARELSLVVPQARVPRGVCCQRDFRAFRVEGRLPLSAVGVLASLVVPLARAGVSLFSLSTYDTDYILVRQSALSQTVRVLTVAGHSVTRRRSGRDETRRSVRE